MFMNEQQQPAANPQPRSLFNIRQDHLTLLALFEDQDGVLEEGQLEALTLTEDEFQDKALSYGFVVLQLENEAAIIDAEIKRLQARKGKSEAKAETFRNHLDAGMRQFNVEKIKTPTLTISYRASNPVELSETFQDDILQYCDYKLELSDAKIRAAREQGIDVNVTEELVELFKVKIDASKTLISDALKAGVKVPGAAFVEKKNLQIK